MIPCPNGHCLICHPRLILHVPVDPSGNGTGVDVLLQFSADGTPYLVVPEGTRIEPIADLRVPAPANRC